MVLLSVLPAQAVVNIHDLDISVSVKGWADVDDIISALPLTLALGRAATRCAGNGLSLSLSAADRYSHEHSFQVC